MRFSTLLLSTYATALAVLASPIIYNEVSAGTVITNKNVTYTMSHLNEIKAFDAKVDNGQYPYPVTYSIATGYTCIFYLESTRGVGSPIGEFTGPITGAFHEWIECYKCWAHEVAARTEEAVMNVDSVIPCGNTRTADGSTHSLSETRKENVVKFAVNGKQYMPAEFFVTHGCACRFYTALSDRFGNELISENIGEARGGFGDKVAYRYSCWR